MIIQTTEHQGRQEDIIGDSINIKGLVEIQNGDTIIKTENKFVQSILAWFANICSISNVHFSSSNKYWNTSTYDWDILIGSDQITPTLYDRTALVSQIGLGTSNKTGYTSNPSAGIFRVVFSSTWVPGAVSGTVGEMALYLSVKNALQAFGWSQPIGINITETKQLVSRLAYADSPSAFSPFTINTTHPLSIAWTIEFSF